MDFTDSGEDDTSGHGTHIAGTSKFAQERHTEVTAILILG